MLKYRIFVGLMAGLICLQSAQAQIDQRAYDLQNVTPPSPNAASLGQYADWPVDLFTGLPEINIPIYELKGRNLSVPVGLSYHASGIKVGENASSVGLGWSLQAGGVITRSVRGLPDDAGGTAGYLGLRSQYNNPADLSSGTTLPSNDSLDQVSIALGNSDSEPDLYMFTALGRSYKFYFSGDGTIITQPYSNLKITFNGNDSSWTVLTEDGTQLLFGGGYQFVELTSSIDYSTFNFVSSWYLRSLVSAEGDTIHFTYTASSVRQDGYYYQVDYMLDHVAQNNLASGTPMTIKSASSKAQNQTISMLTPATIESDLGRIDFTTASRSDLTGAVAITGIKVFSKLQHAYIKSYQFYYGYSAATPGNVYTLGYTNPLYRLKLDSLEELPSDNTPPKFWQFAYNPRKLPSRKSFAQDYWGYFNGATTNTTFLPLVLGFDPDTHPYGNRSADSASMMAEMLTKITYPTGGYSQFTYEPNSYPAYEEQFGGVGVYPTLYLTYNQTNFSNTYDSTFTITQAQYFSFQFEGVFSSVYLQDYGTATTIASAELKDNSGNVLSIRNLKKGDNGITYTSTSILLNPGTYTFTMSSISPQGDFGSSEQTVSLQASFSYIGSLGYANDNHLAGGVRIKSIIYNDNIDSTKNIQKYYQYENAYIVAPFDPATDYVSQTIDNTYDCVGSDDGGTMTLCGLPGCLATSVVYQARNSSTKFSLGSIQGGTVGYGKVTEKFGQNAENGEKIYYYSLANDINVASSRGLPYPEISSVDYERGLLLEEDTYTSGNALVEKNLNNYQFTGRGSIKTYKVACQYNVLSSCNTYQFLSTFLLRIYYQDFTNQVEHISSTNISYNTATGDSVQSTTYYYYDDSLNMKATRSLRFNSKGDSVLEYSRTPFELGDINSSIPLSAIATAALDTMLARNMVGKAVESETYVKGALTFKGLANYKVQSSNLVLPDNMMMQNAPYPIETRVNFSGYDNYGNLLEQSKTGDLKHEYIYDYSATYPIAEVINGDSASVAYTSFEADGTGNWTIGSGAVDTTGGITGRNSYNLTGNISKVGLNSSTTYIVSYWTRNSSAFSIGGTISGYPVKGKTILINNNRWTLFVHKVTGQSTITLSGSGHIDELRLYPSTAQMTTYTFAPLIGMTSQTDVGNRITYYEYDGFQRLKRIRDQDYDILKTYEYQYQATGGCGSGCYILGMQTFAGTSTLSYPVGVFDVHGNLVGNATGQSGYISLWNSDTADARIGTLAAGPDSMHFNITLNAGQTVPAGVTGCRYYQYDLPWNVLDGITSNNGAYVAFGDGTSMQIPKTPSDTPAVMPPNTTRVGFFDPYDQVWWFIHSYPDTSTKTITFYHNDDAKAPDLDNGNSPATSLTKVRNLRGNIPQNATAIGGSCFQQASALSVAGITNWNTITSIQGFWPHCGDQVNACEHMSYVQDFMAGNRGLTTINTTQLTYYQAGYRDTTFKLSRLKSDWNTYFTNLGDIEISDEHWNREDLSGLTHLSTFVLVAGNQNHSNTATGNSIISIPTAVTDTIINQIAAGGGQHMSNGVIWILTGGTGRTAASQTAVNALIAKKWAIVIDNVTQVSQ